MNVTNAYEIAQENQKRAFRVIEETGIISVWEAVGARVNLVGSLKTGLLVTHRDIDFHIYSDSLNISNSFRAMAALAEKPGIERIAYTNLADTDEFCLEWHAWYRDGFSDLWQLDMIHILRGSTYDGYFERVAERISEVMTPEMKSAIICLKYETPEEEKIPGITYYQAVIEGGVRNMKDFRAWMNAHPHDGINAWMP